MKHYFICLANSKKYNERCVAGIEVKRSQRLGYYIVLKDEKPRWLRPVTSTGHGEVPAYEVANISLMDVVEIDVIEEHPAGYQSENIFYKQSSMKILENLGFNGYMLNKIITPDLTDLFGNKGKAVSMEDISEVDHSLVLIKVVNPEMYQYTEHGKNQLRCKFYFNGHQYDLPITDIKFIAKYENEPSFFEGKADIFFTISLGVCFEGWHYKLIAGVICL